MAVYIQSSLLFSRALVFFVDIFFKQNMLDALLAYLILSSDPVEGGELEALHFL